MIRIGAFLVGLFFSGWLLVSFLVGSVAYVSAPPAESGEHWIHKTHPLKDGGWSFEGPLGHYDKAQLQRGFQVFKGVCSACHSLKFVAFRDLSALGYKPDEIKAIARDWMVKVPSVDPATGEAATRDALPTDHFPSPFANVTAARLANNNAVPPDLSLMAKARHHGSRYIYSLLTGYQEQPAAVVAKYPDVKTPELLHYNPYSASINLAMAPPLMMDGQVEYGPGQPKPTIDQMARDVTAFLTWAAEPKMETRKTAGVAVLLFLLVATGLAFLSYRAIWAGKKG